MEKEGGGYGGKCTFILPFATNLPTSSVTRIWLSGEHFSDIGSKAFLTSRRHLSNFLKSAHIKNLYIRPYHYIVTLYYILCGPVPAHVCVGLAVSFLSLKHTHSNACALSLSLLARFPLSLPSVSSSRQVRLSLHLLLTQRVVVVVVPLCCYLLFPPLSLSDPSPHSPR